MNDQDRKTIDLINKMMEQAKLETFLAIMSLAGEDKRFDDFIRRLVKNGCPVVAIIKTFGEIQDAIIGGEYSDE